IGFQAPLQVVPLGSAPRRRRWLAVAVAGEHSVAAASVQVSFSMVAVARRMCLRCRPPWLGRHGRCRPSVAWNDALPAFAAAYAMPAPRLAWADARWFTLPEWPGRLFLPATSCGRPRASWTATCP